MKRFWTICISAIFCYMTKGVAIFVSYILCHTPQFSKKITPMFCVIHIVPYTFYSDFSVILHVGTREPIKNSYKTLTLLSELFFFFFSELLISGSVGKEKPKVTRHYSCSYKQIPFSFYGKPKLGRQTISAVGTEWRLILLCPRLILWRVLCKNKHFCNFWPPFALW